MLIINKIFWRLVAFLIAGLWGHINFVGSKKKI